MRVLRSAGATLDCGSGTQWMRPPSHNVLQRGASGSAGPARVEVLQWLEGLPLAKFNESTGGKRLIFGKMASELWAIIHCGAFETYHRAEFEDVLAVWKRWWRRPPTPSLCACRRWKPTMPTSAI